MIARMLLTGLICMSLPLSLRAAEKASKNDTHVTTRTFTVFGTTACNKWIDNTSSDESWTAHPERRFGRLSNLSWLAGYVSGINRATATSSDLLEDLDLDTVLDWVDTYCKAHPKDSVKEAVDAMLIRLNRFH